MRDVNQWKNEFDFVAQQNQEIRGNFAGRKEYFVEQIESSQEQPEETKLFNYMDNEFAEAEDKTAKFGNSGQSTNQEEAKNKQNKLFDFFGKK